jgi:hypothetical protein
LFPLSSSIFFFAEAVQHAVAGLSSLANSDLLDAVKFRSKDSHCAKYQTATSKPRLSH